jgi:redox-sensitive bicupin YhaK (pirin superfamily)
MKEIRSIRKIISGRNAIDGAGVKLVREFGYNDTADFDPFLLLDAFDSSDPSDYIKGFPWHPHRGIETITYLIEGNIEHGDSMGNTGNILSGDCQWMTAGSGIIHQEMPVATERLLGAQLWLNLPARHKMVEPEYRAITKEDIPVIDEGDKQVHIVCGKYKGSKGAIVGDYIEALYLDVEIGPNTEWSLDTERDHRLFIYIIQGEAVFGDDDGKLIPEKHVILFNDGLSFKVSTKDAGTRFLLMSGKALGEAIAWGGPIVMNTQEELEQAFSELDNNTFIKNNE